MGALDESPAFTLFHKEKAMFTTVSVTRIIAPLAFALATTASAQEVAPTARTWELRLPSGAFIATGTQRDHLRNGGVTAIQLSRTVGRSIAITGTFGWARSRDLGATDTPKLDVFTSDIGLEACSTEWLTGGSVSFSTFAGLGGGARSYNYRSLAVDATNNLAAYASFGGELGMGRVALRVEARDYVTGFKPLIGTGKSDARNDVVIMAAFRFNRRAAEAR
jgi:hypothetical protein